jgi:hypothetical protein
MSNPALHFFQRRHENIRLACRGADVALLSDADGYVTYGQDAERVIEAMKRRILPTTLGSDDIGPFRQITLPVDKVAEAINAVNQLGWSVAIVDRHGARLVCVTIVPAVVKTVEKEEAFV